MFDYIALWSNLGKYLSIGKILEREKIAVIGAKLGAYIWGAHEIVLKIVARSKAYLIFVIFFTRTKFLESKIYTEKRQFFAFNLSKKRHFFCVKSVENANFAR